jgi:hypothetical protein
MSKYVFSETQRFNQLWIWLVLAIVGGVFFYKIVSETMESGEILLFVFATGLVVLVLNSMRLEIRIDDQALSFTYFPFIPKRSYPIHQIDNLELIKYNSLFKFGGWGIRYNGIMWAYNVSGKFGVLVTLNDRKFLLGTQRPKEMKVAIENFKHLKSGQDAC